MTLIPWQGGKNITWDVTVTNTIADSYLHLSAVCAGSAAEGAASRNEIKYAALDHSYTFILLAFATYGPINKGYLGRSKFQNGQGKAVSLYCSA